MSHGESTSHSIFDEHGRHSICEACFVYLKCVRFIDDAGDEYFWICRPCYQGGQLPAGYTPNYWCDDCRERPEA